MGRRDEIGPGIRDARGARFGHQRDRLSCLQAVEESRAAPAEQRDERRPDRVAGQEFGGRSRVLAGDRVNLRQDLERPQRDVLEVADGRGHDVESSRHGPMLSSAAVDGILLVDKDPGKTSHDIVAEVRHALDERHAGHTGTLEPAATGLLVVALGRALKVVPYHEGHDKEYAVTVRLGVRTETDDAAGRVLEERDASGITREAVDALLPRFSGTIRQRPPAYSAVKVDGERAYRLARRGEAVELPEREVTIRDLRLERFEPPFVKLVLRGSKGTYVRSIARDMGDALGCGGSVAELRRLAVGPFRVDGA